MNAGPTRLRADHQGGGRHIHLGARPEHNEYRRFAHRDVLALPGDTYDAQSRTAAVQSSSQRLLAWPEVPRDELIHDSHRLTSSHIPLVERPSSNDVRVEGSEEARGHAGEHGFPGDATVGAGDGCRSFGSKRQRQEVRDSSRFDSRQGSGPCAEGREEGAPLVLGVLLNSQVNLGDV